jgi:hypothetical protein
MSLQLVANHLAQKGRGPDSTLVHMSNREVAGLNALAKKHGGQLSVNPDTGLPEAGFLDSILPTIAGAGLTYFSGGTISPLMAAGIVGGISALDSKDLSKGLMAGLGAYGGAGLTEGLMGVGTGALEGATAAQGAQAGESAISAGSAANASNFDKLSAGAGQLFSNPGQTLQAIGGGSGYKAAGMLGAAAAPIIADEMVETTTEAPPQDRGKIRPYTYSRQQIPQDYQDQQGNMGSRERRYFNDSYTAGDPYSAAGGGLVALAAGGYTNQNIFRPTTPLPANNMYGASRDAYDYLMGANPPSGGGQYPPYDPNRPFPPMMRGEIPENGMQPDPNKPKIGTGKYVFDPVTRQYKWIPDPIKPVDVAAPVFENPAQRGGGGGQSQEQRDQREENLDRKDDYLSTPENPVTMRDYWAMDKETRDALDKSAAERNPIRGFIKELGTPIFSRVLSGLQSIFPKPVELTQSLPPFPVDQEGHYITKPLGQNPSAVSEGTTGEIEAANAKAYEGYSPPQGDPAQRQQAEARESAARAAATSAAATTGTNVGFSGAQFGSGTGGPGLGYGEGLNAGFSTAQFTPEGYTSSQFSASEPAGYTSSQFSGERMNGVQLGQPAPAPAYTPDSLSNDVGVDDGSGNEGRGGRDSGRSNDGGDGGNAAGNAAAQTRANDNSATSGGWFGGGNSDARGGYLQNGKFDQHMAHGGIANLYNLGSYSDGGRLLKGPGDGVSDDIPATIGHGQPARLADGEFVIPARIVSEIGNGSTDAGARELYKMMDRIQAGRRKTVGKDQVAKNSKAVRHLPA